MTTEPTTPQSEGDEKTAAVWFAGFMALALGGAGLLIAALAVGVERAWSGSSGARADARARRGSWLENQRSWLDMDHKRRLEDDRGTREWMKSGANPATRPSGPTRGQRFGRSLRRLLAGLAVSGALFSAGVREGWSNAQRVRRNGGGLRDIWQGRRGTTSAADESLKSEATVSAEHTPELDGPLGTFSDGVIHRPDDVFTAEVLDPGSGKFAWACRDCPAKGFDYPSQEQARIACESHPCTKGQPGVDLNDVDEDPVPSPTEGENMTAPTVSNATVLAGKLGDVNTTVSAMTSDVDALAVVARELREKAVRAADLAHSGGMPTAAIAAVDAIQQAAHLIDSNLDSFSTSAEAATAQLTSAVQGLAPVIQAEDKLHAAGADGRALDTVAV